MVLHTYCTPLFEAGKKPRKKGSLLCPDVGYNHSKSGRMEYHFEIDNEN